jgi:hypothetical protein
MYRWLFSAYEKNPIESRVTIFFFKLTSHYGSCDGVVYTVTRLRKRPQKNSVRFAAEPRSFLILQTSKLTLRPTQWVPGDIFVWQSGRDVDQSPPCNFEVNVAWSCVSNPTRAFRERCLLTHREIFTNTCHDLEVLSPWMRTNTYKQLLRHKL